MNITNEIKEAFSENKKIFLVLLVLFAIGFVIGAILADDIAPILMPVLKEAIMEENVTSIDAFNIMSHNLNTAAMIIFASALFGIFAAISAITNGFVLGFMAGYTVKSVNTLILYLVLILPHGIIELPALFCSCASGILLFLFIFRFLKDKINHYSFYDAFDNNRNALKHMLILMIIAIVLFVIAALIEGFITPELGNVANQLMGGEKLF
ncbi:MAG: stage II sporulation protein M [Methanobrevibacter sp.]|uniref:stage II sporulation protein M n=1 Tax=Methanobrevibacter sp. TaxID=66852 RepID=UPI0025E7206E|nr:stage II sporulation protein M [Methanobrevibacter sp.]MBR0271444.1 stage II sporulation protein M [Methanobrevibacter sp.]